MASKKRLIDYQKAREIVLDELKGKITTVTAVMLSTKMKYATVDAVEVVHGRWIRHPDDLFPAESTQECSVCHEHEFFTLLNENYCPNCGAKMDGERKDNERKAD